MAYTRSADGVAHKGKTKGKNLGDTGPSLGIQAGAKGSKKSSTVTNESLKKLGRNMARAKNQGA